jgi:mevalonate kinase
MDQAARASAPAKIILFGEHAVVHGQPAIAAPVSSLRAHAEATCQPAGSGLLLDASDLGERIALGRGEPIPDHPLARAATLCLSEAGAAIPDMQVRLRSDIPIASGLGSGAALTAALMRVLLITVGASVPDDVLNGWVYEVEREFHGTPSGIDNTVVVFERPLFFVRGERPALLAVGRRLTLLVADTGIRSSTKAAVDGVHALLAAQPDTTRAAFARIGALVHKARNAIATGDVLALGPLMDENHALLQQLTVSSPELDRLVAAARQAGAWGAKLSGGGRGGNMIALCSPGAETAVQHALETAGAARVFATRIEAHA